jgi:hypothetical protein
MTGLTIIAHGGAGASAGGSAVASWTPMLVILGVWGVAVVALFLSGRPVDHPSAFGRFALRPAEALERLTGIPGWAAVTSALSMFALLLAGVGFYSDVAYHIAYGRDEELFTPPHVAILIGLTLILVAAVVAVVYATLTRVPTKLRLGSVRVPWSALPLGVIGVGAVTGFPVDELWHQQYGVDVTMWSPPHLMMILGAAITGLASWLVVAESGARPRDSAWARGFHVVAAWLTLLGLTAAAGEFYFGVPQWQLLFHPVLVMLAAGLALVPMRLVLGRGWVLGVAAVAFVLDYAGLIMIAGAPIDTYPVATYLGSAVVVELAAVLLGTERRLRFAVAAGVGIGTLGLGVEWAWIQGGHLPWGTALFPDALLVGLPAAIAAAVLGAALGSALTREQAVIPPVALVVAGLVAGAALLAPVPREEGDIVGDVIIEHTDDDHGLVRVHLDPPDAADGARWFVASAWQGGDRTSATMQRVGPGEYLSDTPIELTGEYKSLLRLHRGAEMMAIPIRLPEDPGIGEPEIPAEDRVASFVYEEEYLQREVAAHDEGGPWFRRFTFALLAVLAIGWVASLTIAARGLAAPAATAATAAPARRPDTIRLEEHEGEREPAR